MGYFNSVIIYPSFLTEREVEEIHIHSKGIELQDAGVGGEVLNDPDAAALSSQGNIRHNIRQSDVKWMNHQVMPQDIRKKIEDGINQANSEAQWNLQWDEIENHQYTIYRHRETEHTRGDFYTWHVDSGPGLLNTGKMRKLSSTIQLSAPEDYEGGNFEYIDYNGIFDRLETYETQIDIANNKKPLPFSAKEKGTLIVFPSHTYHQVTPVIKGTRVSLVSWFHGQPHA